MRILGQMEVDGRLKVHRNGYLRLARTAAAMSALERSVELQRELGVDSARLVSIADIVRVVPGINPAGLFGGLLGRDDGHVDPYGLAHAYVQLAREFGATIREHTFVERITVGVGARHRLFLRGGEILPADVVVNAAGSWGGSVNATAGIEAPVSGFRHQVATFEMPGDYPGITLTMDFIPSAGQAGVYFRKDGDRRLVAGLHDDHLDPAAETDPDMCPSGVEQDFVDDIVARLAALLPSLADHIGYVDGWSGLYPFTPAASR